MEKTYQAGKSFVTVIAVYKTGARLDLSDFRSFCVHEHDTVRAYEDINALMALISERYPECSVSAVWH